MKKSLLHLTASIAIAIGVSFSLKAQTLLYDFPFNNTLSATVGTGTFSSTGVTYTSDRFGNPNSAINLNNTGTTATLTGLPLGSAARTISLWVKMNTFRTDFNFLYNYGTVANPEGGYIKPNEVIHFAPNHSRATSHNSTTVWVHYVFTYDGTTSRIYVNGTLAGTSNVSKNTANNSNLFRLGLTENGTTNYFNGVIDGLKIYDGAVSDQFVQQLYLECSNNSPVPVNTTPSANLSICSGSTANLSVQSDSLVNWFDVPTGGTSLGSGNTFATQVLTANTTFYAEAGTVCKSSRLPITVNVSSSVSPSTPQILSDTAILYCAGSQATLSVQSNATVRWYDAPTGGNLLATGSTYQTPLLANNAGSGQTDVQNIYVESFNSCANPTTSSRVAVQIKVGTGNFNLTNTTPEGNYYACVGAGQTLSLNTNATNVQWVLDGVVKGTGNSYITAPLLSDSTYFARVFNAGGCTTLVAFPVTVYARDQNAPTNLTNITTAVCPGDSITLRANSANGAPLVWSSLIGNSASFIGITYDSIRVSASNNGQYFVRSGTTALGIGCPTQGTTIQVNVTPTPVGTISLSGTTISSTNLFDTYVLLRNGTQVAQSTTTGTFTFNNATCGDYQALFTNTVNSCPASISMQMRRQNVSTGCDNIIISSPSGITFPATAQARKGGGTFTAPIPLNQTGTTNFNNICTVIGGTNNLEVRIVGANGCVYLFNRNTNNVTTSTTPTTQIADYLEGDLLTSCTIRSNIITVSIAAPTSTTSAANLSRCFGQTTTLTATGTGTLRWYNQATGGTPFATGGSITTPPVTATSTYYVEAFSNNCVSPRTAVTVTLSPQPVLVMDRSIDTVICQGETVFLNATFNNPINVVWTPQVGPSTDVSPTSTTTYTVTVGNTLGCTASSSITIIVNPVSATSQTQSVCFGETTIFKGKTLTQSGIYRDTLTNALGCDSVITLNFTVRPKAENIINAGICTGQSYTFKGQQLTQSGQYFDTLTTTAGCDSFVVLNLAVNNFVTGSVSASICQGQSFAFKGQQLTQAGQYLDTLVSVGGCDSILTLTLTVNTLPQPTITQNGNLLSTQTFNNYQWQLNNTNISNANAQSHTATQNGNYTVVVTDVNGCTNTSGVANVTGVGISETLGFRSVIYPNPTSTILNIESDEEIQSIQVADVIGRVVVAQSNLSTLTTQLSTAELAQATYFIHIRTISGKTAVKSFVKQ